METLLHPRIPLCQPWAGHPGSLEEATWDEASLLVTAGPGHWVSRDPQGEPRTQPGDQIRACLGLLD